ncbi:S41 family peptidase [Dyadobacter endophyticus]|uniref:S41 family peptidase n=1 Tax=Dyadobacter endophyticus TaxID=1749036 RepID=UPI003CF76ACF
MTHPKLPILWERVLIAFALLLLLSIRGAIGQSKTESDFDRLLETSQLRDDFQSFRTALSQHHPDMYRYRPEESLNQLLDSCQASISGPMSLIRFNNLIRFAVSALECGHTSGSLPGEIMESYAAAVPMFPLKVWFADGHAFVLCSKDENAPAGSEILSIDGESIENIRRKLMLYLPSDGKIETKKNATLNNDAFLFLYNFIYGVKATYRVSLAAAGGNPREVTLKSAKFENTLCPAYKTGSNAKPLEITYPGDSLALLTIRTFSKQRINDANQDFPAFLETAFQQLQQRKITRLIIDLRGNGGGDDIYGALLYSYLTAEPFRYFLALQSRSKPVMTANDHPGLAVQQPAKIHFQQKVFVLIDGRTFSTAADFCAIARSNGRAIFIGEETGGGYEGNNSGGTVRVTLPYSSIQIAVPTVRYANAVKPAKIHGRGIVPEYAVTATISDMLEGRDPQLQKAFENQR